MTVKAAKNRETTENPLSSLPIIQSIGRLIEPEDAKSSGIAFRKEIVERMAVVLNSFERRNVILLGKAGTGKTTLLRQLASLMEEGKAGAKLEGSVLVELDVSLLKGEDGVRGNLEKRIRHMWSEAERHGNVVFFMDEAHKIMSGGADSIGNILKPLVTSGKVPMILATTDDEYLSIEKDTAMKRRFSTVHVPEPDGALLLSILKQKGAVYAKDAKVSLASGVPEKAAEMAKRFIHDTADPDRSLRVIEKACSIASLKSGKRTVTEEHLRRAVAMITNSAPPRAEKRVTAQEARRKLAESVKGQEEGLKTAADFLVRVRSGFCFEGRPKGALLIAGPSGCGKTLLAESAGELLGFGAEETVRIDLSQLGTMPVQKLVGYADVPGILTAPLRTNPRRLVLLEEADRAESEVHQLLQRVLNEGVLRDAHDRTADFGQSVVIMTASVENPAAGRASRIGFDCRQEEPLPDSPERQTTDAEGILPKGLLDGIGGFVALLPLREEHLAEIFRSKYEPMLREKARDHGCSAEFSPEAGRLLASEAALAGGSARELERLVLERLMTPLAGYFAASCGKANVRVEVRNGDISVVSLPDPQQDVGRMGAA